MTHVWLPLFGRTRREEKKRRNNADGGASGIFRVPAEWGCKSCDVMGSRSGRRGEAVIGGEERSESVNLVGQPIGRKGGVVVVCVCVGVGVVKY